MQQVVVSSPDFHQISSAISRDGPASFDSSEVRSLAAETVGQAENLRTAASQGLETMKECCSNLFSFVKYDIFANFFQQIGLWFENLRIPVKLVDGFRAFFSFVSLCWSFVLGITELTMFYIWSILSSLMFLIWLFQKRGDPVKEIQGPNTYGWQRRGSFWLFYTKMLVTALTTLYMPCLNSALKVIFCDPDLMISYELNCYTGRHLLHMVVALLVFAFIGLWLPFTIYRTIRTYQPAPQGFDAQGRKLDLKENREAYIEQYQELLKHDLCPYKFLYAGYEYGWSTYKVISLVIKMLLVIPCIPFIHDSVITVALTFAIVLVYCILSTIMRPFLQASDDWLDICARVTSVVTLLLELLVVTHVLEGSFVSVCLVITHILNLLIMIVLVLSSLEFVHEFLRRIFSKLKLTHNMDYDLVLARKEAIWQRFWMGLLADVNQELFERLQHLDDVVRRVGRRAFQSGLFAPTEEIGQLRRIARELEGVDVYYKGEVWDPTYWGRMYINAFPFVCTVVYDETEKAVEIHDHNIGEFVRQNLKDPAIVMARKIRWALRCLDGEMVHFEFTKYIRPLTGNICTVPEVACRCRDGYLRVLTRSNDMFCHGFDIAIDYVDGVYTDASGNDVPNQHVVVTNEDLGIDRVFRLTPSVERLLSDVRNRFLIDSKWEDLRERFQFYRRDLDEERQTQENVMHPGFWLLVYDNQFIPPEQLHRYLTEEEVNPVLRNLIKDRKPDFQGLYARLRYYDAHPAISYWYTFWEDVYTNNMFMKALQKNEEIFDLTSRYAIAYNPVSIPRLKENLVTLELRSARGGGLFNDDIIGKLEEKLTQFGQSDVGKLKMRFSKPPAGWAVRDQRQCSTVILPDNAIYLAEATTLTLFD
jgi:hypothetical protein